MAIGLSNLLRESENIEIAQRSAEIIRFFSERGFDPATTIKDAWSGSLLRNALMLLIAFTVPSTVLAFVYLQPTPTGYETTYASPANSVSSTTDFDAVFGPKANNANPKSNDTASEPAVRTCPIMPSNGEALTDTRDAEVEGHVLTIDNGTTGYAIIKLRDAVSDRTVVSFFVQRGEKASLENIPDGSYTIQYAVGDALAEDCKSFPKGKASADKFPGPHAFTTRYEEDELGTTVVHKSLTYTLYPVPGGNIRPESIGMEEFEKP